MVELRKRKTPPPAPEKSSKKKSGPKPTANSAKVKQAATEPVDTAQAKVGQVKDTVTPTSTELNGAKKSGKPEVGKKIDLEAFGGEVETNNGTKTTLKKLLDDSKAGVVLFTYPKASTPGCTKQACLFRDAYTPLTATGLSIYGLSADSPKSNTTFKTKQNLPYPLLCNPSFTLIKAIGLAKPGSAKGTVRGVFVVDKAGNVLAAGPGGPDATVEIVRKIVDAGSKGDTDGSKTDGDKVEANEGNGAKAKGQVTV